jgi:hypothetical protein
MMARPNPTPPFPSPTASLHPVTPCAKAVDAAVVSLDARGADSAGLPALGRLAHMLNLADLHADFPSTSSAAQLGLHQVLECCTSGGGGGGGGVQGCKGRACDGN